MYRNSHMTTTGDGLRHLKHDLSGQVPSSTQKGTIILTTPLIDALEGLCRASELGIKKVAVQGVWASPRVQSSKPQARKLGYGSFQRFRAPI